MDRADFEQYAPEVREGLTPPPTLCSIAASDLQGKALTPIRWFVQKLVTAGLTIIASPPKFGKSWLVLDICLSVAMGGTVLGYRCERAGTLYLALEDMNAWPAKRLGVTDMDKEREALQIEAFELICQLSDEQIRAVFKQILGIDLK